MKKKLSLVNIIMIFILACLIVGLTIFFIISGINEKPFEFKSAYSFSETRSASFGLSESEKTNINEYLEKAKCEDTNFFGFSSFDSSINLYFSNALTNTINIFNDANMKSKFKNKLNNLPQVDIDKLTLLEILYYVNICKSFNIGYNNGSVIKNLEKFYERSSNLFFVFGQDDLINIKIIATNMCIEALPELINSERFNIKNGIAKALAEYKFKKPEDQNTFYNSGGDIILTASKIENLLTSQFLTDHISWLNLWKRQYEFVVDDAPKALAMSDFYSVLLVFEQNHDIIKIQNFYNNLSVKDLNDFDDYQMIVNILKYVDISKNILFKNALYEKIESSIDTFELVHNEADVISTCYGILLSKNTGYNFNIEKVNQFVSVVYSQIPSANNLYMAIDMLYYNIILEQQINNFKNSYDVKEIQSFINAALEHFTYKEDISNDLLYTRKIIEIVADASVHVNNLVVKNIQRNKIAKAVKDYVKSNKINETSLTVDLFYICDLLNLDTVTKDDFYKADKSLSLENGNQMRKESGLPPDILTTFSFFTCYMNLPYDENVNAKKEFVNNLKVKDAIYLPYKEAQLFEVNLRTILYSNIIINAQYGMEKTND